MVTTPLPPAELLTQTLRQSAHILLIQGEPPRREFSDEDDGGGGGGAPPGAIPHPVDPGTILLFSSPCPRDPRLSLIARSSDEEPSGNLTFAISAVKNNYKL